MLHEPVTAAKDKMGHTGQAAQVLDASIGENSYHNQS